MTKRVLYVVLYYSVVGFVELVYCDHFDVGDDVVFGAIVEHLLGLGHAADHGAGEAVAVSDKGEAGDGGGGVGEAYLAEGAVKAEEGEVVVEVVGGGDAVEDEVVLGFFGGHGGFVPGDDDVVGTESAGVGLFAGGGGEEGNVGSEGVGEL